MFIYTNKVFAFYKVYKMSDMLVVSQLPFHDMIFFIKLFDNISSMQALIDIIYIVYFAFNIRKKKLSTLQFTFSFGLKTKYFIIPKIFFKHTI